VAKRIGHQVRQHPHDLPGIGADVAQVDAVGKTEVDPLLVHLLLHHVPYLLQRITDRVAVHLHLDPAGLDQE
jgi:hypothetical protein